MKTKSSMGFSKLFNWIKKHNNNIKNNKGNKTQRTKYHGLLTISLLTVPKYCLRDAHYCFVDHATSNKHFTSTTCLESTSCMWTQTTRLSGVGASGAYLPPTKLLSAKPHGNLYGCTDVVDLACVCEYNEGHLWLFLPDQYN